MSRRKDAISSVTKALSDIVTGMYWAHWASWASLPDLGCRTSYSPVGEIDP